MTNYCIGTMGFAYKQWMGPFYPAGMVARSYLAHYSQYFNTVEIDSTFYGTPSAASVERWAAVTPDDFTFCLKTPRAITHELRLVEAHQPMKEFLEVAGRLGNKLGVILIQLPPDFTHDYFNALMTYLKSLPTGLRFAVEFRHRSWDTPGTATLLERYQVCWVSADYIHMPLTVRRTADFLYLRFIGPRGRFPSKDRELVDRTADLEQWRQRLQPHLNSVDTVYGFFNDDYSGHSPATSNRFKSVLGLPKKEIRQLRQGRLF